MEPSNESHSPFYQDSTSSGTASPEFVELNSEEEWTEDGNSTVCGRKRQRSLSLSQGGQKKKSKAVSAKSKLSRSTPITLQWLDDNYVEAKDQCLPRSTLYMHYQDFCKKNAIDPVSQASFGKFIRQKFPNLSTRRLGTRGQSKYHYYGIAIKETSPYFHSVYSKKGLTRFSTQGTILNPKKEANQFYTPNSKCGTLLPEFPSLKDLPTPPTFPIDKLETFMMMYRTHCQRIVDTVVRTNFNDVNEFLVHFWQGMPAHLLSILTLPITNNLITVADFLTYQTLLEVMIPSTLQPISESLMVEMVQFGDHMLEWLGCALSSMPSQLSIRKWQAADMFSKQIKRQISLVKLAQPARNILRSSETITSLLDDWRNVKFSSISSQASTVLHEGVLLENVEEIVRNFGSELEKLLVKQPTLDQLFEWLDSVLETHVEKVPPNNRGELLKFSQQFLLLWNYFGSSVERELTLNQARSYSSFRDLILVLDEYVSMVLEILQFQCVEQQYKDILKEGDKCFVEGSVSSTVGMATKTNFTDQSTPVSVIFSSQQLMSSNYPPYYSSHCQPQNRQSVIQQPPQSYLPSSQDQSYPPSCALSNEVDVKYTPPLQHDASPGGSASYRSFPLTPSPSHASSSSSPEPGHPFEQGGLEADYPLSGDLSSSLFTGTSHCDYVTNIRFERVDSIPSANSSSRCSLYSDNHPLMSPSLGTPKFDCLGLSPLESNLFDFNSYSTSQGGFQNGDLDWLDCLTPESEEKLFEPYGGFFSPSNTITIPSV